MTSLTEQLPYVSAFPDALGTGLLLHTANALDDETRDYIGSFIHKYEAVLSRFRDDSVVGQMRAAAHGGSFDFPDWASGLFDLYDQLFAATDGAIDPCVGEDLIRLGYDESYSFAAEPDTFGSHLGAIHGRPTWANDVERHGTTLITRRPVALDFGACGKGYLVDLIAGMLGDGVDHPQPATPPAPASGGEDSSWQTAHTEAGPEPVDLSNADGTLPAPTGGGCPQSGLGVAHAASQPTQYVIDAGGDLLVHTDSPITIALEDPANPANAVGAVEISQGAFCASSPSRRHWSDAAGHQLHHLLNAIGGLPCDDVAATWVAVTPPSNDITMKISMHGSDTPTTANRNTDDSSNAVAARVPASLADGLATALFTTSAAQLRAHFPFECAILNANRTAAQSPNFPGAFFTR